MKPLLVFDMDGVLVEVTESYRESIRATVKHFTGQDVPHHLIQTYKNRGGWNNDWKLSQELCLQYGEEIPLEKVVEVFDRYFRGTSDAPGLIERERWIADPGLLEALNERYDFAVFTGRLQEEAQVTLKRFGSHLRWFAVIADDDVEHSKPHPAGLLKLKETHATGPAFYLGDTIDDALASLGASVPFIAITGPGGDFAGLEVAHRIANINDLEAILNHG